MQWNQTFVLNQEPTIGVAISIVRKVYLGKNNRRNAEVIRKDKKRWWETEKWTRLITIWRIITKEHGGLQEKDGGSVEEEEQRRSRKVEDNGTRRRTTRK